MKKIITIHLLAIGLLFGNQTMLGMEPTEDQLPTPEVYFSINNKTKKAFKAYSYDEGRNKHFLQLIKPNTEVKNLKTFVHTIADSFLSNLQLIDPTQPKKEYFIYFNVRKLLDNTATYEYEIRLYDADAEGSVRIGSLVSDNIDFQNIETQQDSYNIEVILDGDNLEKSILDSTVSIK